MARWVYTGWVCIHFNRKEEAPLYASITPAPWDTQPRLWEVLAAQVSIHGADLHSASRVDGRPGLDPVWWLQGDCRVELGEDGVAHVYPAEA